MLRREKITEKEGFSLMELIATITIIGVLASLALPNYGISIENSKITEATRLLAALKDAQVLRKFEYGAYTTSLDDLEVTASATPKHYNDPELTTDESELVKITRNNNSYRLSMTVNGVIDCTDVAEAGICAKLRY